ncbi:MAG: response regulator [Bacteroidales bacterium]|nr:response regulator [Bacteroidales bacterium]
MLSTRFRFTKQRCLNAKWYLFFAWTFMIGIHATAQISNPHFVRLNTSSGLPSDNIQGIDQDEKGFIWLSTKNGLARFDGTKVINYQYNQPQNSNPVVDFTSMLIDDEDLFWYGSYNGLLLNYNRFENAFSEPKHSPFDPKQNPITILFQDSEKYIWVGNQTNKLWRIDKQNSLTDKIELPNEGDEYEQIISSITEDTEKNLWIGTNNGLYKYDKKNKLFSTFKKIPYQNKSLINNQINCLYFDKEQGLWIGTEAGLDRLEVDKMVFTHYNAKSASEHRLSASKITAIFIDSNNQLWVGTNKGLNLFRKDGKGFQLFNYNEYLDNSLPSNYITDLFEDSTGHLWVATQSGGAAVLDLHPKTMNNQSFVDQINDLVGTEITTLFYDKKTASLWIGTESEGVYHFLLQQGAYPYAYYNSESNQLKNNSINKIYVDANANIWIIYSDNSIELKREKGNKLLSISLKKKIHGLVIEDNAQILFEDETDKIWLVLDKRVVVLSVSEGKIVDQLELEELFNSNFDFVKITAIVQDYRKNIWFASESHGVVVYNPLNKKFEHFVSDPTIVGSLSSNRIQCLFEDSKGVMWLGTADGGLNKYNRINNQFETITKTNGLVSNNILSILEDSEDHLWVGTSAGLNRINQSTNSIALFDKQDGLKGNGFVENATALGKDSNIYFATQRGFNAFNPLKQSLLEGNFELVLTDLIVNSLSVFQQSDSCLQRQFLRNQTVQLKPSQRNIGIEFSALEFLNPSNVSYYYKLEGVDQDWVESKRNNYVSYINLSSGNYKFYLKASDKTGNLTNEILALEFIIATPFYKRLWFVLLVIFFSVALIFGFIQIRIRRITYLNQQLESQVSLKTKELVDANFMLQKEIEERKKAETDAEHASQSKSQFLANMSHEIRTPMNAIIGFTDLLTSLIKDEKQRHYLNSIQSSGKSLLILINDILDLSKIEAGHFQIDYKPINLIHLFEEIKQVFALKCDEKDLLFEMKVDKELPKSLIMSEIRIRQVLVNLIGNALKFTEKGQIGLSAHVIADAIDENKINLLIQVSDTGIGIEPDQQKRIFQAFHQTEGQDVRKYGGTGLGLSISRRLVELMGGKIDIESEPGKGSIFKIYLNDVEISDEEVTYANRPELPSIQQLHFKNSKLLVVDDSALNRSLIVELFRDSKVQVIEAGNGQEAIDIIREQMPDLVLMDIRMPVLNGFDAVKIIRSEVGIKNIPVFALTASISEEYQGRYAKAGFNHVLLKPLEMGILIQELTKYLPFEKVDPQKEIQPEIPIEIDEGSELTESNLKMAIIDLQEIIPKYELIKQQKFINEILLFAKQVGKIGEEYNSSILHKYASDLIKHTENFDTEKMEKVLNQFPQLVMKLETFLK